MDIVLVTPARAGTRHGNRNTAERWAELLRAQGHRVRVETAWDGTPCDLMIALHARRSHESIARCAAAGGRVVLVLTGTDVYRDIRDDAAARTSLALAARLVVLQAEALRELAPELKGKARVIHQSAVPVRAPRRIARTFEIVVSGHLRPEKDPFRCAAALRLLKRHPVTVTHVGGAMEPEMAAEARRWMRREPRYRWLGEVSRERAMRLLGRARLMVISSVLEGGANVVSEALAQGVPVVASRIPGNIGLLGRRYAGYFTTGREHALARVVRRATTDARYYRRLLLQVRARRYIASPSREGDALRRLLLELAR